MRTIYLQRSLSINGRGSLGGRVLADRLRRDSEEFLLGAVLFEEEAFATAAPMVRPDLISEVQMLDFDPTVVICEGGLFTGRSGGWKMAQPLAEQFVRGGGTLVVADVELNVLREQRREYQQVVSFLGASADYRGREPVGGYDEHRSWQGTREIRCQTDKMIVSDWLQPVYDGVPEILCGLPVRITTAGDILASGNTDSTWSDATDGIPGPDDLPWASVRKLGGGFVALLAGAVTGDVWLEGCPHNTKWLANLCAFLSDAAVDERTRAQSVLRSEESLFLSHASPDKATVAAVYRQLTGDLAVGSWIDQDRLLVGDSLPEHIEAAIQQSTAFVLFWSKAAAASSWVLRELTVALQSPQPTVLLVRLDDTPPPRQLGDMLRIDAAGLDPDEIAGKLSAAISRRRVRRRVEDARQRGVVAEEAAARRRAAEQATDYPAAASLTRGRDARRDDLSEPIRLAGHLRRPELLGSIRSDYYVHVLSFVDSGTLVSGSGHLDRDDLATAQDAGLIENAAKVSCPTGMDGYLDDHRASRRHLLYGYSDVKIVDRGNGEVVATITAESDASVVSAAWSPAGDRIVIASTNYLTISDDRGNQILHRNMYGQQDDAPPLSVAWHPSANPVYASNRRVVVADPDGRTIRVVGDLPERVSAVAVSSDCRYIAGAALDGAVNVWSEWGELVLRAKGVASDGWHASRCLAFSPDGRFLVQSAPVSGDGFLVVDMLGGRTVVTPNQGTSLLAFHPAHSDILVTGAGKTISFWRLRSEPDAPAWQTLS